MPPQGYYGTVTSKRRKRRKPPSATSGPRMGRPGSGSRRTPRVPRPQALAPQQQQPVPSAGTVTQALGGVQDLSGGTGGYDLGADPAVAAAAGLAAKQRAMAQATALAKRKQAALEYGDPTGIDGVDEATAKAARENPFSILKNLDRSYTKGRDELEEGLNSANLFYSGYRGQQLGEAARGYQQSKYDAGNSFRGLMTDINDRLAEALMNADMYEAGAIGSSDGGYYGGYGDEPGGSDGAVTSSAQRARAALGAQAVRRPALRMTTAGRYSNAKRKRSNSARNPYAHRPARGGGSY